MSEHRKRGLPSRISLVLSDVDGTLVTGDKVLTPSAREAAAALERNDIRFTIASSRPPFGLASIVEDLSIRAPFAAFNGGLLTNRAGDVLSAHWIDRDVAQEAIAFFEDWSFEIWAFTATEWLCRDSAADYVERERRTVSRDPKIVDSFDPYLSELGKLVAVSTARERLSQCETVGRAKFTGRAVVARSQSYYLDVTHPKANKADALVAIAKLIGVSLSGAVAIGDGMNDIGMLDAAAYGVAMGNGVPALREVADYVCATNEEDGFADAVAHILGGPR